MFQFLQVPSEGEPWTDKLKLLKNDGQMMVFIVFMVVQCQWTHDSNCFLYQSSMLKNNFNALIKSIKGVPGPRFQKYIIGAP